MFADVVAAVAVAVSGAGIAVALVSLIYAGPLIDGRPSATASVLLATGIGVVYLALRSQIVPLAAIAQDAPAVVLVALLASLISTNPDLVVDGGSADWVVAFLAGATLLSGTLMWLLGRFGLGEAVRYLPTIVVNAFVAGTGWLLAKGGFEVMVGRGLGVEDLGSLFDGATASRWLPGLVLGLVVFGFGASKRVPDAVTSGAVVVAAIGFYAIVAATSSVAAVEADGWLVGPFEGVARPTIVTPATLAAFPAAEISGNAGQVLSLVVITLVALLLNLSALETTRRRRVDTSHELRQAGLVNLVISPLGSIPVFHALGDTLLAEQMGVRRRSVLAASGLGLIVFGVVGAGVVGFVPVFVAGGLLVAVGVNLLAGWIRFISAPIGWSERALSALVLGTIMVVGILEGVVFGLILACALFVFRYSRVDPIRRSSDLNVSRSRIDRSPGQVAALLDAADDVQVIELQGFLFFGSTTKLADRVRSIVLAADRNTRTVIFDLRFVTGVEPGTANVIRALFDDLSDAGAEQIVSWSEGWQVPAFVGSTEVRTTSDLDDALAMVEEEVLARAAAAGSGHVGDAVIDRPWLDRFEAVDAAPGTVVIAEGDTADTMLFLLSGACNVIATSVAGERHRVRQFVGPSWVGEIWFLRATPRNADVVASTDVRYAVVERAGFDLIKQQEPAVAADILLDIATTAADRTATVTEALTRSLD